MRKTPHEQSYETKYIFLKTEIFFKVSFLGKGYFPSENEIKYYIFNKFNL